MVFSLSTLLWRRIRSLWKLPDGRDWLRGKLGLVLVGRAMLSKSLIQFSVDGTVFPPCYLTWGQTMVEVMKMSDVLQSIHGVTKSWTRLSNWTELNEDKVTSFTRSQAGTAAHCTQPCSRPPPTPASAADSWTLVGRSRNPRRTLTQ